MVEWAVHTGDLGDSSIHTLPGRYVMQIKFVIIILKIRKYEYVRVKTFF